MFKSKGKKCFLLKILKERSGFMGSFTNDLKLVVCGKSLPFARQLLEKKMELNLIWHYYYFRKNNRFLNPSTVRIRFFSHIFIVIILRTPYLSKPLPNWNYLVYIFSRSRSVFVLVCSSQTVQLLQGTRRSPCQCKRR